MTAPTAARRQLGQLLKNLRGGMSPEAAAKPLRATGSKIRRIERGVVGLKPIDLTELLDLYDASPEDRARALDLFNASSDGPAWWSRENDITPAWFTQYLSYEHAALRILIYEAQLPPTLLMTSDYLARAIIPAHDDPKVGRRWADLHLERQRQMIERGTPATFYIEESALTRDIGSLEVAANQLRALAAMPEPIVVRVVPHVLDSWVTQTGPFVMMDFADPADQDVPPVIYREHLTGAQFFGEKPSEVEAYAWVVARLDKLARSVDESRAWLLETADKVASV